MSGPALYAARPDDREVVFSLPAEAGLTTAGIAEEKDFDFYFQSMDG